MSRIKVECRVRVYKRDGASIEPRETVEVFVRNGLWNSSMVELDIGDQRISVVADDLIRAIKNAENAGCPPEAYVRNLVEVAAGIWHEAKDERVSYLDDWAGVGQHKHGRVRCMCDLGRSLRSTPAQSCRHLA